MLAPAPAMSAPLGAPLRVLGLATPPHPRHPSVCVLVLFPFYPLHGHRGCLSDARMHDLAELLEEKNALVKRLQAENARLRDATPTSAVDTEVGLRLLSLCV